MESIQYGNREMVYKLLNGNTHVVDIKASNDRKDSVIWRVKCGVCNKEFDIHPKEFMSRNSIHRWCECEYDVKLGIGEYTITKSDIENLESIWDKMIDKCCNPYNKDYFKYYGRGIRVCDEWYLSEAEFIKWSIRNGYRPWLKLKRRRNREGYNPSNCYYWKDINCVFEDRENIAAKNDDSLEELIRSLPNGSKSAHRYLTKKLSKELKNLEDCIMNVRLLIKAKNVLTMNEDSVNLVADSELVVNDKEAKLRNIEQLLKYLGDVDNG